jgi:hypothetical protein
MPSPVRWIMALLAITLNAAMVLAVAGALWQ